MKSIVESWSPELVVSSGCCSPRVGIDGGAGVERVAVGGVTRRNLRNSVGVLGLVDVVLHGDALLRNSRYSAIWRAFWARSPRPMDCHGPAISGADDPKKYDGKLTYVRDL